LKDTGPDKEFFMEGNASPNLIEKPAVILRSLGDRLLNVFVSPGDVFEEAINSPPTPINWLVPILITCFVGVISFLIIFEQPSFRAQLALRENPRTEPDAQSQLVRGTHSRFEENSALARAKLSGEVAIVGTSFIGLFWSAFVLWLMGRFLLKVRFPFMKALEIVGLTGMILVLSTLTTTLLVFATEDAFAKPALSLLVSEFDPANKFHLLLSMLDVTSFWTIGLLSIGLAKLSRVTIAESAFWVFGYWIALRSGLLLLR
jgi:hypothetical protein